jgi:Fe-S oxidoreductase
MEETIAKKEAESAFDAHHPPSNEIIEKCVHCGFCLPVCPTYVLWGQEMDSPRGRIYLMKLAGEGAAEMNANWVSHFDSCLGCMACMSACPSGVDYGKLIEATRAQIERKTERPRGEKLHRRFMFETFTQPDRLRRMRLPLLVYQKSGLQAVVRELGLLRLLPKKLQAMERLRRSRQQRGRSDAASVCCWVACSANFSHKSMRPRRAFWPPKDAKSLHLRRSRVAALCWCTRERKKRLWSWRERRSRRSNTQTSTPS